MIKLYELVGKDDRRFSPTCWRVRMALAHKGLAFETVPTPFTGIQDIGDGIKMVPVIEHDGRRIDDSGRIADYLEATFPDAPTLFGGDEVRALTNFVDAWVLTTLHATLFGFVVFDIHEHCLERDQSYFRASREQRLNRRLEDVQKGRDDQLEAFHAKLAPLRGTIARQQYLGGERPIYADYIVLGAFQWVRTMSPFRVLAADDPVRDYVQRLMALHGGFAGEATAYPL